MDTKLKTIFLTLLICFLSNPVLKAENQDEQLIKMIAGETRLIPTTSPERVIVGNPAVADVIDVSNSEITLNAKSSGITNLIFWDSFGEQSIKIKVYSDDVDALKKRVDNLLNKINLPEVYSQAEPEEGKVLLLGRVKNAMDIEKIATALGSLKDKTVNLIELKEEETGVEIDVQVLELDKDATTVLGLTNPLSSADGITFTEVGSPGIVGSKWSTLFKVLDLQRPAFVWTLFALTKEGKARILSRPRLACQSGKEAELLVGGEKPIMTTTVAATTGAEGTDIEYKEFGIKLKIKPVVMEDDRIKLFLNVDIKEVASSSPDFLGLATAATAKAYPFSKRVITTELFMNNGQTLAIGGLIKQKEEEDLTKTPGLADIPIIGALFRKRDTKIGGGTGERGNTELFITLTPTIIENLERQARKNRNITEVKATSNINSYTEDKLNIPSVLQNYVNVITDRIVKNVKYPEYAKSTGFQGEVKLGLHLSYSGELLDALVKNSSGFAILDNNALSAAKNVASFPPFPPAVEQKDLWIEIPVVYRLE